MPNNIPWFWIGIAASALFLAVKWLWRTEQQEAATGWPSFQADIDSVDVDSGRYGHDAIVEYKYHVEGKTYSGTYKRSFVLEKQAWDFIAKVQLLPTLPVRYKPAHPATSCVLDDEIDQAVQRLASRKV